LGAAPHSDLKPMEVLIKIVEDEPPSLQGSQWSDQIKNFVHICLNKKPQARATIDELLEHDFLKKAKDAAYIK